MRRWRALNATVRRYWWPLLGGGAAVIAARQWRQWRRDQAALARLAAPAPLPLPTEPPLLSVLVAAWNEAASIEGHLASFQSLTYPRRELILCAGGSDGTFELAGCWAGAGVRVLAQRAGEGKQAALTRCLAASRGELLYLTDADCRFDDQALRRLLAPLLAGAEQVTTGPYQPWPEQRSAGLPQYLMAAHTYSAAHQPAYVRGLSGANTALTRAAVVAIGGLGFAAPSGTDYQLAQRLLAAGLQIAFVPDSVIATRYPVSWRAYRRQQSRWLRNLLRYSWRFRAWSDLRAALQTVLIGWLMIAAPGAALLLGPLLWLTWLLLLLQATLAKLRYLAFAARRTGRALSPRLALALPALSLLDFAVWASAGLDLVRRVGRW